MRPVVHAHGFIRHYVEMVLAMYAGMLLLGGLAGGLISMSGTTPEHVRDAAPEAFGLVMALNMSLPMALWMRHRGHRPRLIAEMSIAMLAPALAAIALLLSGIGIYGLLAYTVVQRAREIGVRMALGAEPAGVARMIVSQAMRLAAIGVIPGIVVAYLAARGMRALLFGVAPADPSTVLTAVGLVLVMTLAGSLVPVLRAVRVNPLLALRAD